SQRGDAKQMINETDAIAYPPFLLHSDLQPYWPVVFQEFPEYQLVLRDSINDAHLAHGNMIPFSLAGAYEDLPRSAVEMVEIALRHKSEGRPPTVLGALQAVVHPVYQSRGLSAVLLQTMAGLAAHHGFTSLFAPIRPSQKAQTPLTPFAQYVEATR